MRKKGSCLPGSLLGLALLVTILAAGTGPAFAVNCHSASANVALTALHPSQNPAGHQSPTNHCYAGRMRGALSGDLVICVAEQDAALDTNLCACDTSQPLWTAEGEGRALIYRSRAWIFTRGGSFEAIERGTQVENSGYPLLPYPDDRHYWAGVMQVLPDSGIGDFQNLIYGTIMIHNRWNDPSKAKLMGEVCVD